MPLDAREGFVLSRIDGTCTVRTLAQVVGMSEEDVALVANKLLRLGAIRIKGQRAQVEPAFGAPTMVAPRAVAVRKAAPARPPPPRAPPPPPANADALEDVDLSAEDQHRINSLFSAMSTLTHYDVLQVARDVTAGDLKAAYYRFSKEFHPDRFYGRQLGSFKTKLETLFKNGKVAYEVLNNTEERRAYDKQILASAPPVADAPLEIDNEFQKRAQLEMHRQRIIEERRSKKKLPFHEQIEKAKAYAQEGEDLFKQNDMVGAAEKFALALAYDPKNAVYERRHDELAPLAAELRVKTLTQNAGKEIGLGNYEGAYDAYKKAFDIMPTNPQLAARAAEYCLKQGNDIGPARSLIQKAISLAPNNGDYALIAALVHEKAGEKTAAQASLQRALELGCDDPEAKKLSKRLR
jgi:tetratricopeptide (TPR) repeat protein